MRNTRFSGSTTRWEYTFHHEGIIQRFLRWLGLRSTPCLTAKDDPVLARTWDNEDDAIFDDWQATSLKDFDNWESKHGLGEEKD